MSSIAKNKKELIDSIQLTYNKLKEQFDDIPEKLADKKTMIGQIKDTKMSVNNLLSYLIGWGELMIKWDRIYTKENRIPDLPDTGYTMNDWGKLAKRFYKDYEKENFKTLLRKYDIVVLKIIKMLEGKDNKELFGIDWYITKSSAKGYSFGRMVQLNTSSPYKNAYNRLRKWKKENGLI